MTSTRERKQAAAAGSRPWLPELAIYAGLVVLVIVTAIVVAVTRGGEEESVATEDVRSSAVLNTEPWGEPDYRLLDEVLNPVTPAPVAAATGATVIEIGGFAIAEPWGEPGSALPSTVDPVGAGFRAMEPGGTPDYELLASIVGLPEAEPAAGPR